MDNAQTFVEMCLAKINALGLADLKAIGALCHRSKHAIADKSRALDKVQTPRCQPLPDPPDHILQNAQVTHCGAIYPAGYQRDEDPAKKRHPPQSQKPAQQGGDKLDVRKKCRPRQEITKIEKRDQDADKDNGRGNNPKSSWMK